MGEVHVLELVTRLDCNPDRILEGALGELESVVIVGYDKNHEEYFASSIADGGTVAWLMDRAKFKLLKMVDDG